MKANAHIALALICFASLSGASSADSRINPQNPPPSQPDSGSGRRYADYADAYLNALPFIDAAEKSRIQIGPEAIRTRLAVYKGLYPGQDIDTLRVRKQLQAEKYLETSGHKVDDRQVEDRLESLGVSKEGYQEEELGAIRQAVKAELLFKTREIIEQGERRMDVVFVENQDIMAESRKLWPLDRIRLNGAPAECLAWLHGRCHVTLEEYNAAANEFRVPRGIPLDSAKALALRQYLSEKCFAEKGLSEGLDKDAESILEKFKIKRESLKLLQMMKGLGRPVRDPKTLRQTYGKYHGEFFKARDNVVMRIIGSSDSSYIDSVHRRLVRWQHEDGESRKIGKKAAKEPDLPWLSFREEELPLELVSPTDTFYQGQFTGPIKTAMGFFISRVWKISRVKEVPFEAAHSRLVFLATRDKYLGMDSVMNAKSLKYYHGHLDEFITPDTLALTAWLIPYDVGKTHQGRYLLSSEAKRDTSEFSPIGISSLQLPRKLQAQLGSLAKGGRPPTKKPPFKPFYGPLKGEHGQWFFKIDSLKKAGDTLQFRFVKEEIRKKLGTPEIGEDTATTDEARDDVLLTLGLAKAFRSEGVGKLRDLTGEEIARRMKNGSIDTSDFPESAKGGQRLELSKRQLIGNLREDHLKWKKARLEEAEIEYGRLFQ